MISHLCYDWKESLTLEMLKAALVPFGIDAVAVENSDDFEFMLFFTGTPMAEVANKWRDIAENWEITVEEVLEMFVGA